MLVRAFTPAAFAAALTLAAVGAGAQQFQYTTGTNRYLMSVRAKVTQTAMGQTSETELSADEKFTMDITMSAADTMAMTVTIDSIAQELAAAGPMPGLDSLVGRKVRAWLSRNGTFYASKVDTADTSAMFTSVAEPLVHLLPRIPVALARGASWTDTTMTTVPQGGLDVKRTVVSTYTVAGDTTVGGTTAWNISRTSASTSAGSGTVQGHDATLDGTSTGTATVLVSHEGTFLGGAGTEDAKVKVTITDAGVTYDVGTNAKTKIERLK
jgi:hypothetical protein